MAANGQKILVVEDEPDIAKLVSYNLAQERFKVLTPQPATPDGVADSVRQVVENFGWTGPVGLTFPGVVTGGSTIRTAANVDKDWIDTDAILSQREKYKPGTSSLPDGPGNSPLERGEPG